MSKKMIGGICAIIAMLAGGSMVIIGTLTGSWENLWLIPFCGGILIAAFSIIAGIAYDEIESFGPYENLNDGSHEGQKRIKECGVAIKMRAYRMPIKIPIAKNVDTPLGGERILEYLNAATGGKHSSMIGATGAVASTILNNI